MASESLKEAQRAQVRERLHEQMEKLKKQMAQLDEPEEGATAVAPSATPVKSRRKKKEEEEEQET